MNNIESTQKFLEKYNINPYKLFNIKEDELITISELKKRYKKRALVLHPDKTNGETELEFKLLRLSYNFLKEKTNNITSDSVNKERNDFILENIDYNKQYHEIDFNNKNIRKELFVDDNIDFEEYENEIKIKDKLLNKNNYKYSSEKNVKLYKNMFKDKSFDIDKFNTVYNIINKNESKSLIRYEDVKPFEFNTSNSLSCISYYDGVIIPKSTSDNRTYTIDNYYNYNDLKSKDELQDITVDEIEKNTKNFNKYKMSKDKKLKKSEVNKLVNKLNRDEKLECKKHINLDKSLSNNENINKYFEMKFINKLNEEDKTNKKYLMKYKHIYNNSNLLENTK